MGAKGRQHAFDPNCSREDIGRMVEILNIGLGRQNVTLDIPMEPTANLCSRKTSVLSFHNQAHHLLHLVALALYLLDLTADSRKIEFLHRTTLNRAYDA